MTLPPLVTSADLRDVPAAAGLTDRELALAAGDVRGECGWHIAPRVLETLAVSGTRGRRLLLPTRYLDSVELVSDAVTAVPLPGWRIIPGPMLYRQTGWPTGDYNIAVVARHGHERVPDDVVAVVLERALAVHDPVTPGVRAELRTSGEVTRSRTYTDTAAGWSLAAQSVLDRYRVR